MWYRKVENHALPPDGQRGNFSSNAWYIYSRTKTAKQAQEKQKKNTLT